MKRDIDRIYNQLKFYGLVINQFDFSTHWLGQCRSYFSSMKARGAEPSTEAALALVVRLRSYNEQLRTSDKPRTCVHFGQMSQMLEQDADLLAQHLLKESLQRVFERQAIQAELVA